MCFGRSEAYSTPAVADTLSYQPTLIAGAENHTAVCLHQIVTAVIESAHRDVAQRTIKLPHDRFCLSTLQVPKDRCDQQLVHPLRGCSRIGTRILQLEAHLSYFRRQ